MNKNFKLIAEAMVSGRLAKVDLPTHSIDHRRVTIDELKTCIEEEFEKAKDVAKIKAKEGSWSGDAELAKEIEWMKALDLKEWLSV